MIKPYRTFNSFLKNKFNHKKIRKIPINAGFLCPNKDGRKSDLGCVFCDSYGSGPIKSFHLPISEQIEGFINKNPGSSFIAYFQAHTNTYAPVNELKQKYSIALKYPEVIGLFIGTRPDSISDDVYPLLEELNRRIYLSVELGLQSIHPKSITFLNRCHTFQEFLDTFQKLKERNLDTIVHLILGIPGETKEDMHQTIREMNRLKPTGIKFHLMHVLKNTPLYEMYTKGNFKLMEKDEYVDLIIDLLENLDPSIVIHRLTGERDKEIYHAPLWALNKIDVINSIRTKMIRGDLYQGSKLK
jgi:radical SAM protein (TIGR01212 family)